MYNIELLAKLSEISKRTIRYYIEKGLLEPPLGTCRASYYTEEHLHRLEDIKRWANQGVPLTQIKSILDGNSPTIEVNIEHVICTHTWERLNVWDGVELHFRTNYLKPEELRKIDDFIKDVLSSRCCD
ncbi:MAG: MerR family transcriptional regulator [Candidatus Sericytochromatia bacterium]